MVGSCSAAGTPAAAPVASSADGTASVAVSAAGPVVVAPAPTPQEAATTAATTPPPGSGDRGRQLYLEHCASCHGEQGQGSQRGPSLVGVGPASTDFQLSTGRMPVSQEVPQARRGAPVFSADDIAALVGQVASFGGGGRTDS